MRERVVRTSQLLHVEVAQTSAVFAVEPLHKPAPGPLPSSAGAVGVDWVMR